MAQNFVEDFAKHCMYNKKSSMEYFDSCKQTREYQMIPEVRKIVNTYFSSFCFNNGLWNRIIKEQLVEYLNDTQQTFLFTILKLKNKPKDRYNQHIMNYYFKNMNVKMNDFKGLETIDIPTKSKQAFIMAYYNQSPALFEKIKEIKDFDLPQNKEILNDEISLALIKNIPKFIKLGKCLQFNVKGFVKNQLLYLLYGLALYFTINKYENNYLNVDYKFKDLINTLKSFVQFNLDTKCFNVLDVEKEKSKSDKENYYNLITFLILGTKDGEKQYNYRYTCAEKYFDLRDSDSVSYNGNITEYKRFKDDGPNAEATSYKTAITTEYKTKDDVISKWEELEEEFKANGISDKLIKMWFDSQLLTRSTCLIGCMLIVLKENKYIEFIKDEMPDWKAIGMGTIEGTYNVKDDLETLDVDLKDIKVKHVLLLLEEYVKNCEKYK